MPLTKARQPNRSERGVRWETRASWSDWKVWSVGRHVRERVDDRRKTEEISMVFPDFPVVYDCATPNPRLVRVEDPFGRLLAQAKGSVLIGPAQVMEATVE